MGWCASKLEEWGDYFYYGRFTVLDTTELPYYVKRSEWYSADGKTILRVLYNAAENKTARVCGVSLKPDEMRFDVFKTEEYLK